MAAKAQTTATVHCDGELVTNDHLDADAESHGVADNLHGVRKGRFVDEKEVDEFGAVALSLKILTIHLLVGHNERRETVGHKLLSISLERVLELLGLVTRTELDDNGHTLLTCHFSLPGNSTR